MLIKTASWTGAAHNALATETQAIKFDVIHKFNNAAVVNVECWDLDGTLTQKYNGDSGDCYIGTGRMYIEEPTGTPFFDGRIIAASHNIYNKRLVLLCKTWDSQLEDEDIIYDMREVLRDNSWEGTVYESTLASSLTESTIAPVHKNVAVYTAEDANSAWGENQFNGNFLVISGAAVGKQTETMGPSVRAITANTDTETNGVAQTWARDYVNHYIENNDDEECYLIYHMWCRELVGSLTTEVNSITISTVFWFHAYIGAIRDAAATLKIYIYNYDSAAYELLTGAEYDSEWQWVEYSFNISTATIDDYYSPTDGTIRIKFDIVNPTPATTGLAIDLMTVTTEFKTDNMNTVIDITDTIRGHADDGATYNTLKLDEDVSYDGYGLWEGCPYCICDYVKNHINTIVTAHDSLYTLNTSVEATTGISARRFEEMKAMKILQELAVIDKAIFYTVLADATPTLIWKRTFDSNNPTAWTDATVISWAGGNYDINNIYNEAHVYGARYDDTQIYINTADLVPDPGADSKDIYGVRSKAIINQGLISYAEAVDFGTAFVQANQNITLNLEAEIAGIASDKLAAEININSTKLGLVNAKYVITEWGYDSEKKKTHVKLQPRSSLGYGDNPSLGDYITTMGSNAEKAMKRTYVPAPI